MQTTSFAVKAPWLCDLHQVELPAVPVSQRFLAPVVCTVPYEGFDPVVACLAEPCRDARTMISHTFPMARSAEAFAFCRKRKDQTIKVDITLS